MAQTPKGAPTAIEAATLYYVAGDLNSSREWCERGLKREKKRCEPFLRTLAEYKFLLGKYEELTLQEAALMLVLDKKLSPKEVGKLTRPTIERYVKGPLQRAQLWAAQGAAREAAQFVESALLVDPSNAEAKALREQLLKFARADGGH